ncbi:hypothetical protein PTTG_12152 [Puccinia triticina 1-1 BBBD Race 1]|uniref:Uncharacterized protein n=2 Tax=Puccinia triticina TaxID=208348 RepID=A0A180GAB7_PUCT1|nr:uncharacterized protein PtA15_1A242 [Puccinia triticina]OAV89560.1 hypothetical protein PTTG_12152 [Puccinia triticina 1-1 BBBD Race 1]WAQ80904.1 hypothetical protein PtA15_1A242 [Puccinia triticina]WAR51800.1 hypothetical protein PtB15_1B236 [Puccinia triticina]
MNAVGTMLQIRRFTSGLNLGMPLQPAKQRKTVPIRNPRRPHLPDPIDSDPTAQRFKLAEHPRVMFVIREPGGMANLADDLISKSPSPPIEPKNTADDPVSSTLSHPILSVPSSNDASTPPVFQLPPPLRAPKTYSTSLTPAQAREIQSLRASHSLSQLSRKFNVPRLLVSILGPTNTADRNQIYLKNHMRQIRKEARWSVAKAVRRQEKIIRRSCW